MTTRTALVCSAVATILGSISLSAEPPQSEISAVLNMQQEAWNRGDIDAFMNGYSRSEDTVFVSGDEITRGWQKVLDRYKKNIRTARKWER